MKTKNYMNTYYDQLLEVSDKIETIVDPGTRYTVTCEFYEEDGSKCIKQINGIVPDRGRFFVEAKNDLLIFKINNIMSSNGLKAVREDIKKQMEDDGIIVLDGTVDLVGCIGKGCE